MPRQRGGSAAPRRPTAAPAAPPRPAPQQTRPSSTAAHPPAQQQAPPQQSQGSGLFGQMASTAAGVAVGSSIGHAIGGFFGGGSSAPPAEVQSQAADNTYNSSNAQFQTQGPCATDVGNFRRCMDENQGSLTICGWYLDQLKACQQAASQY
ncbi:hypothetical protein BDZ85DRAFT_275850 [Elsinoe ampelina]|uniref:CHCH domain-containing protein n=1 Tax=Elsinoe ampelina TaxID=302913 RepID=A0A6A6G3K8_9PEZI|nr:hypothetical protein BDZ85DRAFT_275850 [Elsinoe ampelina]